jgi:predicted nucleotidyltransferase
VNLLALVASLLRRQTTPFALIGAGAMAAHGAPRSTLDVDLLVLDLRALANDYWEEARAAGAEAEVRHGDADDPLAGVVEIRRRDESPVDVVVGRSRWQRGILERAGPVVLDGVPIPVATRADLILLKLYAGGAQDAWDVTRLLDDAEQSWVVAEVETRVGELPAECRALWQRIRG